MQKMGRDPREIEHDREEDWLRFRADVFPEFLREAPAALEALASQRYPLMVPTEQCSIRSTGRQRGEPSESWYPVRRRLAWGLPVRQQGVRVATPLQLGLLETRRGGAVYGHTWVGDLVIGRHKG